VEDGVMPRRGGKNAEKTTQHVKSGTVGEGVYIDEDVIKPPLLLRSKKPGDTVALSGGTKRLKDLYNDWKVPPERRRQIPVLEDRNGILAILGKAYGYRNRVAEKCKKCNTSTAKIFYVFDVYRNGVDE
jgi:tRNA(Ile)-lysidine synthetase-like protein